MKIVFPEIGESIKIAIAALRSNKLRTILTTLGIFIGVLVVTVVISIIQGLNKYVSSELSHLGADTVYISRYPWLIKNNEEWMKVRKRKKILNKHYQYVKTHSTLAEIVAPILYTRKNTKYRNESLERVTIAGTTPGYMVTSNAMPEFGRFFTEMELYNRRSVCVIGYEVAEKLFPETNPLGKRMKIAGHTFFIVGILEERGETFGHSLDNYIIIPFTVFQKTFGSFRSINIQIKPKDPSLVNDMIDELYDVMRRSRSLEAGKENDFSINQQSQLMDTYNNLTHVLWIVLIGIGSIALLVGGIGIMNIMLVSVTERTREIGIRKAVGAKRMIIMLQFLIESMFISAIGVTLGILASIGLAKVIGPAIHMPVDISTWTLLLGIGFTVGIGTFFGLYPASKAAKLDPIVALRYE